MFSRVQRLSLLSMILLTQACSTSEPVATPNPPRSLSPTELATPQPFMLRGQLLLDAQSRSFTPCGSAHQLWPQLDAETLADLNALQSVNPDALYAELIGSLQPPSGDGPDADYTARLQVHSVNQVTAAGKGACERALHATQAYGNSPSWQAELGKGSISYRLDKQARRQLPLTHTRLTEQSRRYQFSDGQLHLKRERCSHDSGRYLSGWLATLTQDKKTFRGCAHLANVDTTLEWTGIYSASSKQNNGFTVELALHRDHSATTRYYAGDNQPARQESGFWQQVNPGQIQVIMTRHQGQRLTATRLFSGNHYQLHTSEELVNDALYQITDGGLTLYRTQASRQEQNSGRSRQLIPASIQGSTEYAADVDRAIRRYFRIHRTPLNNTRYRWLKYDLNGDGQDELLTMMNWCEGQGCTLLVFEQHNGEWRFNSRLAALQTPFYLGNNSAYNWQDIILKPDNGEQVHKLSYSGVSYQGREKLAGNTPHSGVVLFADGISPKKSGVTVRSGQ